ncbi:MAG TPA: DNA polymerase Y family protein [Thermoanaerobaculia bacterium]|nr:DNA polymerase Y family protein [Thermoanaerobaculia bacterium]
MTRLACLYVPMFPLAARLRSEPELTAEAVAVVEGNGNNAYVVAATRRARKKGIGPGLSLAQARSLLPKLIARGRDPECERSAQEALLEVAETFSPRIEDVGEGVVFFDIEGMERHFECTVPGAQCTEPSAQCTAPEHRALSTEHSSPEHRLAATAIQRAAAVGLPVRCGIAASKLAARVAAESSATPTIVPPGDEGAFLAPLPLTRLSPEVEAATTLERWGLKSIGDFARLPESEVASRLGEMGRALHHAARGVDPRPLIPRPLLPEFREGMELEWPLVALEPFLFIANAALDRLTRRLESSGLACKRLEVTLTLEPDGYHARAIELPAPTRDVKTMLTLIRLDLEKTPPGAPVVGFTIVAHPDRPRRAQLSLFGPAALAPEKLATAIARLVSMLGADNVGMPVAVDGHLPERWSIASFDPPPPPTQRHSPAKSRGLLAMRVFRPPLPVDVITSGNDIRQILGDGDHAGNVRLSSGPWDVEEGWWRETPVDRRYWDVELERGGVYRVYRDSEGWYVDARYD